MPQVKQSKPELYAHLHEQLEFIRASSGAFDSGSLGEAKRLAVTARVLLHDSKQSKSLLGLLGWKDEMRFFNTAHPFDPKNLAPYHGLVGFRLSAGKASYHAPLELHGSNRPNTFVRFSEWWNDPVIIDEKKNRFNRRELILALANKDGGAHVDPDLDAQYTDLTRLNSLGWIAGNADGTWAMTGVELHSVRQIAYELTSSVEKKLQKLCKQP